MARCVSHEQCPRCASRGADKHGDNLGVYADGSGYCFSCGYYRPSTYRLKVLTKEKPSDTEKTVLPSDFQREVPTEYWKWLLQYGLSYEYWRKITGFTEKEKRLVFQIGDPTRFSIGRSLDLAKGKWKIYGDKSSYVEVIGEQISGEVVLVEDIISAHKVGQIATAIPLFGTAISDHVMRKVITLDKPVTLWLDADQYVHLSKKLGRLQTFTGNPVRYIRTDKDPKSYSTTEIKEILK